MTFSKELNAVGAHVGTAVLALHAAQDATTDQRLKDDLQARLDSLQDLAERIDQALHVQGVTRWW